MKKIVDFLTYEGGEILPHVMYTGQGSDIVVEGKIDITTFGTVIMNGIKVTNTSLFAMLNKPMHIKLQKDSAILFNKVPAVPKQLDEHVPVPDIPDMDDEKEQQMYSMFNEWAIKRGLVSKTVEEGGSDQFDDDEEWVDDMEDDYGFPLDKPADDPNEIVIPFTPAEPVTEGSDSPRVGEMPTEEAEGEQSVEQREAVAEPESHEDSRDAAQN